MPEQPAHQHSSLLKSWHVTGEVDDLPSMSLDAKRRVCTPLHDAAGLTALSGLSG
jgi:hypothetical protein